MHDEDDNELSLCDIYNQLRHESSKSSFIVLLRHASKAFQSQRHSQKLSRARSILVFSVNKIPLVGNFLLLAQRRVWSA